jgi:hypothetical protein
MKSLRILSWSFLLIGIVFAGCAGHKQLAAAHDEVLTYPLPYDLAFLRTMESLETLPDWELGETEKEKGTITVFNKNFSSFTDADQRMATVLVKRVNREETSLQLAPQSQRVIGGDKLMERIGKYLSREL